MAPRVSGSRLLRSYPLLGGLHGQPTREVQGTSRRFGGTKRVPEKLRQPGWVLAKFGGRPPCFAYGWRRNKISYAKLELVIVRHRICLFWGAISIATMLFFLNEQARDNAYFIDKEERLQIRLTGEVQKKIFYV